MLHCLTYDSSADRTNKCFAQLLRVRQHLPLPQKSKPSQLGALVQNFVVHHLGELLCIRINAIARCIGHPTARCIRARVNVVNAHVVEHIEFMCLSRRLAVRAREKA